MGKTIIWILFAVISGQEVQLDAFERPGDCDAALELVAEELPFELKCIGEYADQSYNSQPNWMTPEQAEKLRKSK